jgi:hypothetical protein
MPKSALVSYEGVKETRLLQETETRADRICVGDYSWSVPSGVDEKDWIFEVSAQARALDSVLS